MDIQTIPIDQINPAPYNPRLDLQPGDPDYESLKKAISEFDVVEPLVMNRRGNVLIGGHQRLKVLKELGHTSVEVSVVDLPDNKEKALNLALNKISGDWDMPMLKDLLSELDCGDIDMELTGFSLSEIENLMTQFHVPGEGLIDDDEVPDAPEPTCKTGDLWLLGDHRLLCGDATVQADVDRLMGGEKADMVFTDPPYGINLIKSPTGKVGGGTPKYPTKEFKAVANDDHPFDPTFLLKLAPAIIIWGANYFADKLSLSRCWFVWNKRHLAVRTFAGCELAWTNLDRHSHIYDSTWDGYTKEGESGSKVHPTQKPVKLFADILSDLEGAVVLDPFGGSGTTLIACEKLGRRCYMMEIDAHYCDVIIKRWEAWTGRKAELVTDKVTA